MNGMDCRDEMRLLLGLAPLVQAGGLLVVTLKLPAKVSEAHAAKLQGECVAVLLVLQGSRVYGRLFTCCHLLLSQRTHCWWKFV